MKINQKNTDLTIDKHPFSGFARIMIHSCYIEDDGFGDFIEEHNHGTIILSKDECIKIVNELTKRINKNAQ